MVERITQEELTAIRERAEKASGKYWIKFDDNTVSTVNENDTLTDIVVREVVSYNEDNDATFIANAREDIPKLLAEIVRLRTMKGETFE